MTLNISQGWECNDLRINKMFSVENFQIEQMKRNDKYIYKSVLNEIIECSH